MTTHIAHTNEEDVSFLVIIGWSSFCLLFPLLGFGAAVLGLIFLDFFQLPFIPCRWGGSGVEWHKEDVLGLALEIVVCFRDVDRLGQSPLSRLPSFPVGQRFPLFLCQTFLCRHDCRLRG